MSQLIKSMTYINYNVSKTRMLESAKGFWRVKTIHTLTNRLKQGYKSKDLIIQNVLSFMPTIIIGTVIGITVSYYLVNPYIGLNMRSFGIMKCTMILAMYLLLISGAFLIGLSLISAILMSLKIRKIKPHSLLIGE